jgi:hypothetical protein
MDWFVDEYGYEWYVGEEMEVWFFDPACGWFVYNVYDTTDASTVEIKFKLIQLDSVALNMGCTEIDVSFREYLY